MPGIVAQTFARSELWKKLQPLSIHRKLNMPELPVPANAGSGRHDEQGFTPRV
ncbi:Unknown protein sequence [Pseudomonas syringae pv. syringae]|uniref:Uncharacterized protein n=3 Tax=Pseudomonas syringae group TaxID=136849 RepID=A0A3M5WFS7_9PSED|nr:Unknown protein sequence [Pseudomonas syringae pv. aceris]KPB17725.1 Unknown protein sequence [Pseudomonas syringae pv. syringae]KPY52353.1 hypothetical protein ALO46_101861 [Pseudomonas syringae pv. solidagae]RMU69379.1 hypothetical protein ALP23_101560 [Pseudomonas syringae pv. apii]KPW19153.1 hypothetical protein ALO91_102136 [Pseudomonas syringae pv. aceris]